MTCMISDASFQTDRQLTMLASRTCFATANTYTEATAARHLGGPDCCRPVRGRVSVVVARFLV